LIATTFVGRERELELLHSLLDRACAGSGGVALLVGEPGIGKTRTATVLAEDAREHGMRVLWGRCHEGAGAPSFWPWLQVLRDGAAALGDAELEPWAPVLSELVRGGRAVRPARRQ
jgi:predicted ATPase